MSFVNPIYNFTSKLLARLSKGEKINGQNLRLLRDSMCCLEGKDLTTVNIFNEEMTLLATTTFKNGEDVTIILEP